jgi:uncharacterized iron-regulated membrane protein
LAANQGYFYPMSAKWFQRLRQLHMFLGVFFSPLLLLFIVTGWWQTFITDEDRDRGFFNAIMGKFSSIHTDSYFPRNGAHHHPSETFKILVAAMAVALIVSILIGLALACQNRKKLPLAVIAFSLGILVPVVILYFS